MNAIKQWWEDQPSEKRQKTLWIGAMAVVLLIVFLTYYSSGEADRRSEPVKVEVKRQLNLGKDLLEDDITETVKTDLQQQNMLISDLVERQSKSEEFTSFAKGELERLKTENAALRESGSTSSIPPPESSQSFPTPPSYNAPEGFQGYEPPQEQVQIAAEVIGGVGHSSGEPFVEKKSESTGETTYYLSPGFMKAKTLHGIEALTTEGALANPEPIMIMVQAPAVLPNDIKAQLKGCFVMGNATGSLAKERIQVQIVNLSCISPDGTAVIDQEVLGYVVDADGKKDLQANIVTKMGQHVWRGFLAGAAGGLGEGFSNSGNQTQVTAGGLVQSFDPDELLASSLGSGLKGATDDVKKIFIDLAKQTAPVAESGGAKQIDVVIQQGVELVIRKRTGFRQ